MQQMHWSQWIVSPPLHSGAVGAQERFSGALTVIAPVHSCALSAPEHSRGTELESLHAFTRRPLWTAL